MRKKEALLILVCLILSACGVTGRRVVVEQGAPGSRPWERPYSVDGVRYVPLLSAEGFREEGLASWYGAEEHGGPTSNGEVFDMYKPTAAHKTLPLGCLIRVTSKATGRSTVARVNDRGPFVAGRIVDLSYRGAMDLGLVESGVAPVLVEVLPGTGGYAGPRAVADNGSYFTLQVAAFSDPEKARILSQRLEKEFPCSRVLEVDTARGRIYRVRAGRFSSRSDAEAALSSMARNGYPDAFIVIQ